MFAGRNLRARSPSREHARCVRVAGTVRTQHADRTLRETRSESGSHSAQPRLTALHSVQFAGRGVRSRVKSHAMRDTTCKNKFCCRSQPRCSRHARAQLVASCCSILRSKRPLTAHQRWTFRVRSDLWSTLALSSADRVFAYQRSAVSRLDGRPKEQVLSPTGCSAGCAQLPSPFRRPDGLLGQTSLLASAARSSSTDRSPTFLFRLFFSSFLFFSPAPRKLAAAQAQCSRPQGQDHRVAGL